MNHRNRTFAALVALLAGCKPPAPPAPPPMPPPAVTVARPVEREVVEYRQYTGRVESVEMVEVRARVRGFLQKVNFKEGAEVKAGDLLFEIDPREFQATLARARADVARQEAQFKQASAEADRGDRLRASNTISGEDYLSRLAARDTARAAVQQAKAAVEGAELELSFTRIEAPIAGRIGKTLVTEGNLVGYNDPTLLTTIVSVDPVYVTFDVPESDFAEDRRRREGGQAIASDGSRPVEVSLINEADFPHKGTINFRDNRLDPSTGTIPVRASVPNPGRLLTPGMFARVRVPFSEPQTRPLVPEQALSADQRGRFLLVVNAEDAVEYRPVTVSQVLDDGFAVIEKGVAVTDRVVVNGLQRARPGAKVAPQEQKADAPPVAGKE